MSGENPTRIAIEVDDESDRYHRQNLISWWDQDRLHSARVIVVGAGALGNEIVKNLALMGVGHITVVDMDEVENSNLARCVFFRGEDDGKKKASVLASRASEINPEITIEPVVGDVRLALGIGDFADADVVVGGLDNREARLFVNQACWKTETPWVDGAIEGLMGVVRVFIPPETACYECTMSEQDHQLIASRKSCALLSKGEMLEGKVPTNATSASVVAGIEAQEVVKLLHRDRLGEPSLAGRGFNFVGLTHDSYTVSYQPREDCLSHDHYDLEGAVTVAADTSFADLLDQAREELGEGTIIEFEHELVTAANCSSCGSNWTLMMPVDRLGTADGLCPDCGNERSFDFTHSVDEDSILLKENAISVGLAGRDVVVARNGFERRFFRLDPDEEDGP
ncbi:MAG TPA: ThiF family adenylyltransferase [Solirubrobacterales bacterium]|nr:ThiF family adenylyltransferase [Solirubrobacterales bacterium]